MSDFEQHDLVGAVLTDVSREVAGYIRPAGAAAAHATVRRRRRNRVVAGGVLAAALIVGAAAGFGLAANRPAPGPKIGETGSPSVGQSSAPAPEQPTQPASADAGIPAAEQLNATLTVPAWPPFGDPQHCTSGAVRFTDGKAQGGTYLLMIVGQPVHVDVDGDGNPESAVRIDCVSQAHYTQILVYDRDPGGPIRLMGSVLATPTGSARDLVDVKIVHAMEGTADGHIRLDVGEVNPCCDTAADLPQHQWRTYGWNGQKFAQTAGPTSFGPNPRVPDMVVTSSDVVMRRGTDGKWHGTVTVKVRNDGPGAARNELLLYLPDGVTDAGTGPTRCPDNGAFPVCDLGVIAKGTERTVRVDLMSAGPPSGEISLHVNNLPGVGVTGYYPDVDGADNNAKVRLSA